MSHALGDFKKYRRASVGCVEGPKGRLVPKASQKMNAHPEATYLFTSESVPAASSGGRDRKVG